MIGSPIQLWRTESAKVIFSMELLRVLTAGNVDDGKSTLIGRLLWETKNISQEEEEELRLQKKDEEPPEVAKLLDGLKDEREQGITIDVAYRFCRTNRRRMVIADCPGHAQYTRNLLVGAAQSELALVVVDASRAIAEQTQRHILLLQLLRVPQIVFVINKMDLVHHQQEKYQMKVSELQKTLQGAESNQVHFIPVSAITGENLVIPSSKMPWYDGPTLLHFLETVSCSNKQNGNELRMVVQKTLLDPSQKTGSPRAYAARILSGEVTTGDFIYIHPSGLRSQIKKIFVGKEGRRSVSSPDSISFTLCDDIDIERGDLITLESNGCLITNQIEAQLFWFDSNSSVNSKNYMLRHTCQEALTKVNVISENTFAGKNRGFFKVQLNLSKPIWIDRHRNQRESGLFLIIDPVTTNAVGAGLIE